MPNKSRAVAKLAFAVMAGFFAACDRSGQHNSVSGTIEVDEVHVGSRYGGRVDKIHFDEGARLKKNDVIVEMEAAELEARRNLAAAQLAELEHGPLPAEIEAAKQDWESLKAQHKFAVADAKRSTELLKQKTISSSEAEKAQSTADALDKSVKAAEQRHTLLVQGTRYERVEQARAQLAELDAQIREMRVLAPGDCVLEVLSVKVGDVLPPNREVATLILTQHIWVRVYVPETWLGHIHDGEKVRVRVDSFPDKDFEGVVEQINRQAEFTPRNVQTVDERVKQVFGVKVRLKNEDDKMRAGMAADVFFDKVPVKP